MLLALSEAADLAEKLRRVWQRKGRVDSRPHMEALSISRIAERLKVLYQELLLGMTADARTAAKA